ncbi:hypothetical protein [Streptomyces sp. NPDC058678]|uniref:hypothetical protein n=1 Tax=Streptomyces sp. NPDC058678 TaxID=3346595 RepID=UPI00365E10A9
MTPFTVVTGGDGVEPSLRLRDELRSRDTPCVLLIDPAEAAVAACSALAQAGISTVVHSAPERVDLLLADLRQELPRVVASQPSAATTVDELETMGWLTDPGEVYTQEELETVTARLQELGYS